ncbi:flagellar basal body rod protein FlgB [Nocardioides marmorisolisilvae]|uniref:Flagellar basal body rod protein FlgB n=1 Tax=Nocardioides marmorisolisilvae TaxID=1542737 RepID=A0A3N0DXP7_9ACTN|nr:flagellar basal body rod protein FlgB [Nocardioides marmorisolisilvae]RNL80233.1 flagellar basal body rod protein FlgB [Nocardioides marmorisolisilvae]
MPFAVSDAVSQVLASALDGVTQRQQVIADNIANADTPGFRATSVDFESQLKAAINDGEFASGEPVDTGVITTPTDTPVGANGNNVDLRKETLAAMQSQYQYQILTRAVSERFNLVKTAATGM